MGNAIVLENIRKIYSSRARKTKRVAVDGLSLEVPEGEIFGLLGPNGAGKTTTIKIILNLVIPDEGRGEVLGKRLGDRSVYARLGFLPEQPYFYGFMTAEKALQFYGRLFGFDKDFIGKRSDELLSLVGLPRNSHLTLEKYSKGMLQRFGIAQALMNDPDIVILDEPSGGLDPVGQKEVRDIVLSLKDRGKTVFLSSHQLSEVENVCDSVCIVNRGKAVTQGRLSDLLEVRGQLVVSFYGSNITALDPLKPEARRVFSEDDRICAEIDSESVYEFIWKAKGLGLELASIIPTRKTLEQLFMEIVKGSEG